MTQSLVSPFPIFTDVDGNPLESGYLYVGTAGLNAETNQIQAYWDAALTVPATQPIRTLGGYPSRSGSPGVIYVNAADCSLLVKNNNSSLICSVLNQTLRVNASLITFIQAGTGATPRSGQDKMRECVSVKDFGAVGDGVADDTDAFVLAAASGLPLDLRGATYLISTATVIALTAPMFNGSITVGHTGSINQFTLGGSGSYVRDVEFIGGATVTAIALVVLSTATNFDVSNNTFSTFKNGGIAAQAGSLYGTISNNKLIACSAESSGAQYGAINSNASKTTISGNIITNGSQTGISCFAVTDVAISNNTIIGDNVTVSGGIILDGQSVRVSITGNSISNVNVEGIQVVGSITGYGDATRAITITGNIIAGAAYSGITIYGVDGGAVQQVTITGNVIGKSDLTQWAIQLDRAKDVVVSGNFITGYALGIAPINACTNISIVGNTLVGQSNTAIKAWASKSVVSGNVIEGVIATSTGIAANSSTIAGNVIVSGNNISACLKGIEATFTQLNSITIRDNHLVNNTTYLAYTNANPNSSVGNVIADNVLAGTFTLNGTSEVIVSNAAIESADKISLIFTNFGAGNETTVGAIILTRIVAGVGFGVRSTGASDVSNYRYEFVR